MSIYTICGVEHVYDGFGEFENTHQLEAMTLEANNLDEAYTLASIVLQERVYEKRKEYMATGSFESEVIRIYDPNNWCVFQKTTGLLRYFGGSIEDKSSPWKDHHDLPFGSCFLSYNHKDEEFTNLLYKNLQNSGFLCWYAPINLQKQHLETALQTAIENNDRSIVVISQNSARSDWVSYEINELLKKENKIGKRLIFPIFLESLGEHQNIQWLNEIRSRGYGIAFNSWTDSEKYTEAFNNLVKDLTKYLSVNLRS